MKIINILTIDTANPERTAILLASFNCHPGSDPGSKILKQASLEPSREVQDGVRIIAKKVWQAKTHQSEELLLAINKLLKQNKVIPQNLGLIIVNIGPGSFTGIRVGVATANALAFVLNISVIGIKPKDGNIEVMTSEGLNNFSQGKIKKGTIVKPFYDKKPNITTAKNK